MDRDAARRVAGHGDDAGIARQVQHLIVVHLDHVGEVGRPAPSLAQGISEEPQRRAQPHRGPRGCRRLLAAGARRVGRVDEDRHAVVTPQSLREADVVAVAVREDQSADVVQRPAHGRELGEQFSPMTRKARVHDSDARIRLDQIGSDDVVADPVQSRSKFHGRPPFGRVVSGLRSRYDGYDT